jgi:glycosyltransferase involved in cell wall biosynthesis
MTVAGLVSTIIPVYNRAAQLREAVASVLAQDWRPIEILIVDDGSTDDTPAAAQALATDHRDIIRVVSQPNGGPGAARESGRLAAAGEFIQYLDSDDVLLPGKFTAQVGALRSHPEADVAYGVTRLRLIDGSLAPGAHKRTGERIEAMFPAFLLGRWWETATPLYRRCVTDKAGAWTQARLEEDWEYDCRIASFGTRLARVDQPVCEARDHRGDRLSRGPAFEPARMRDRAASHALIYRHARRARIATESPEMRHFARELFLLARQCGAAGLAAESKQLFELARDASGPIRAEALDFRAYRALASLVGWSSLGRASVWLDQFRGTR